MNNQNLIEPIEAVISVKDNKICSEDERLDGRPAWDWCEEGGSYLVKAEPFIPENDYIVRHFALIEK